MRIMTFTARNSGPHHMFIVIPEGVGAAAGYNGVGSVMTTVTKGIGCCRFGSRECGRILQFENLWIDRPMWPGRRTCTITCMTGSAINYSSSRIGGYKVGNNLRIVPGTHNWVKRRVSGGKLQPCVILHNIPGKCRGLRPGLTCMAFITDFIRIRNRTH